MKNLQYFIFSLIYIFSDNNCNALPLNSTETSKGFVIPCPTVNVFRDSNYTKSCFQESTSSVLCSALYDLGLKWCTMSSQHITLPEFKNAMEFDSFVSKFDSLTNVMNFCTAKKIITNKNDEKILQLFYNDVGNCAKNCLNSEKANTEPTKLCSALTYLEVAMNLPISEKVTKQQAVNVEPKQEESSKPVDNSSNNSDKIIEKAAKDSEKIPSDSDLKKSIPKEVNKSPAIEEQMPKKNEVVPVQKEPSNLKTETKNEQEKKVDTPILDDNADAKKDEKIPENPIIESTGNRPDAEISKTEVDGTKTDKAESGKTGKMIPNNEEVVKSSTISEHTNDGAVFSEDGEMPLLSNDGDQREDILNLPNQEPDLISEKKIIPHYPGKKAEEESHIFSYFVAFSLLFVCCYIGYLNKKKILAILLEGRRSRNGRGRRRPSTANYRKLDSNLEEAVTSQCNTNATNVIY